MAFILGFPANEIVVPIVIMSYMATGILLELDSLDQLRQLLVSNGWTWLTALCTMLFSLMHWPCGTTCWTIRKETQSWRTAVSFLVPTAAGIWCLSSQAPPVCWTWFSPPAEWGDSYTNNQSLLGYCLHAERIEIVFALRVGAHLLTGWQIICFVYLRYPIARICLCGNFSNADGITVDARGMFTFGVNAIYHDSMLLMLGIHDFLPNPHGGDSSTPSKA